MLVSELTHGERLIISRRRAGLTQTEAAEEYGVSLYKYRLWEKGESEPPKVAVPGRLKPYEKCVLARLRNKQTIRELAAELELCRWWVQQMERGQQPCDRLMSHWGLS